MIVCKETQIFPPFTMIKKPIVIQALTKNAYTKFSLCIFLTVTSPTIRTHIDNHVVPTHQFTDCPKKNETITAPTAAGLKICFLLMEKIYLLAILHTASHKII